MLDIKSFVPDLVHAVLIAVQARQTLLPLVIWNAVARKRTQWLGATGPGIIAATPTSGAPMAEKIARNLKKVRQATAHPNRPGGECAAAPGLYRPQINIGKCEGKKDCAEVCPYNVFAIMAIKPDDYARLNFFHKLKSKAHGGIVAYAVNADQCQACGLCVVACPEKAITLVKSTALI